MSIAAVGCGATLAQTGCFSAETGFGSAAPNQRLAAIVEASDPDSPAETLAPLIDQLSSQDAAARMLAIRALERRTGQTFGFQHDAPLWERREAIDRWIDYLEQGGLSSEDSPAQPPAVGDDPASDPMEPQAGVLSAEGPETGAIASR